MYKILTILAIAMMVSSVAIAEDSLQDVLDNITLGGPSSVNAATDMLSDSLDSYWTLTASGGSVSTMIIEIAGYANQNSFGVYSGSEYVQLFDGAATAGVPFSNQATLTILAGGQVAVNHIDTGKIFGSTRFGYYLDTPDGLWHSDSSLNSDLSDHMHAYQGTDTDQVQIAGFGPGTWTDNEFILAFEDLLNLGDQDYQDFVVLVESVEPIPAPGAILLGSLGASFVGYLRRRRAL